MFDTMIFFVVASHPVHVIFLLFHQGIGAPTSHAGFETLRIGKNGRFQLGDFFHQLHLRYFDFTYDTGETHWDRWFDTFHNGTPEGDVHARERRRKIWPSEKSLPRVQSGQGRLPFLPPFESCAP